MEECALQKWCAMSSGCHDLWPRPPPPPPPEPRSRIGCSLKACNCIACTPHLFDGHALQQRLLLGLLQLVGGLVHQSDVAGIHSRLHNAQRAEAGASANVTDLQMVKTRFVWAGDCCGEGFSSHVSTWMQAAAPAFSACVIAWAPSKLADMQDLQTGLMAWQMSGW